MTNEELALEIQAGKTEYYGQLWDNTKRLLYKLLNTELINITLPNYISIQDLQQELYFALCRAVQAYEDTKPYTFNSYLNYSVKCTLRDGLPNKSERQITNNECSYNAPISPDDKESELLEYIEDEKAKHSFENIELSEMQKTVPECIAELPPKERKTVYLFYFCGKSYQEIDDIMHASDGNATKTARKALYMLSNNERMKLCYKEYFNHYSGKETALDIAKQRFYKSDEYKRLRHTIKKRRRAGECISYEQQCEMIITAQQSYLKAFLAAVAATDNNIIKQRKNSI
ncbi:MAG: sigma-70 family RNA polymerase sigma factor [Ruminococcus bromii]|nr:sigma-70 family RNA polymerase sigma factor [Ruminococcus bromii]